MQSQNEIETTTKQNRNYELENVKKNSTTKKKTKSQWWMDIIGDSFLNDEEVVKGLN